MIETQVPDSGKTGVLTRAAAARSLQSAFRDNFGVSLDAKGYASSLEDVLLSGVERADFEHDLLGGAGDELEQKFLAAHSSAQLAVNAFAPFRRRPADLRIAGKGPWTGLRFEAKCPLWPDYRGTPPHLDLLLTDQHGVLGIESKCTEYLAHKPATFSRSYQKEITDERRASVWFRELERLSGERDAYRHLDAAQLVKHALGLGFTYPDGAVTLLYLYWEPENGEAFNAVTLHRREIEDFTGRVAGDRVGFQSLSYLDLWLEWSRSGIAWLEAHAIQLARRYRVAA